MNLLKKCLAEFIATFALVFVGCGAILSNQITGGGVTHVGIALAFGLTIMAMVYATGHISGAHINPAVTVAFSVTGRFPWVNALPYIIAQCLGAVAASFVHKVTLFSFVASVTEGAVQYGVTQPVDGTWMTAFVWEIIATFFLMYVIMSVATDAKAVVQAAGVAIGGTVLLDALAIGSITGASMNPARSFGPALIQGQWQFFSAYVAGPVIGAILGGAAYNLSRFGKPDA